ncbi:hypothetical protein REPUB_Repub06bG0043600 [Reevesia pubescens]
MEIKLASHEHPMSYHYFNETSGQWCDKCVEKISGTAYACERCELWLHESCAKALEHLPREITHPIHPQHHLILDWSGEREFTCDKCLKISSGTNYGCCRCDFQLDLVCAFATNDQQAMKKRERSNAERDKQIIQHYCHSHPLILYYYGNIEGHDFTCSWCDQPLSGIIYGCKGCEFFLHEFCSNKIPKTLNHPFHPPHPLRLQFGDSKNNCNACTQIIARRTFHTSFYFCKECNFSLDFYCAKILPTLKHKCHHHYLTYFGHTYFRDKKFLEYHFECNNCHELCLDSFYRCVQCNLNLHLKCIPIPPVAKHRYHRHQLVFKNSVREDDLEEYYCDVCEKKRNPTHEVYYCGKCTYIAHIECVLIEDETSPEKDSSSAPKSMDLVLKEMEQIDTNDDIHKLQQLLVRHLIHEHPLKFCEAMEKFEEEYCKACHLELSGPGYFCEGCTSLFHGCYLHENCAKLPDEIEHHLHSQHRLNLYARFPYMINYIICDECEEFSTGFFYLCEECDFKLDLKCATRASIRSGSSTLKELDRETELFHFSHRHKLIFCNYRDPTYKRQCSFCKLPIFGPTYNCIRCGWILHESCLRLPQEMQVPIHSQHISVLSYMRYGTCYACGLKLLAASYYNYGCKECHLNFHITCANSLRRALRRESHMHDLYYFGKEFHRFFAMYTDLIDIFAGYFCSHCGQICSGQPFYRCLECCINFHLECVPIPQIVKSKGHIHPFTLKDSFIEDDSGKYYCDICEKERHPSDHVYFCEECHGLFVAHIECALVEVSLCL